MWYWTNVNKALDLEHHMVEDLLSDVGSVIELSPIIFDLLLQILPITTIIIAIMEMILSSYSRWGVVFCCGPLSVWQSCGFKVYARYHSAECPWLLWPVISNHLYTMVHHGFHQANISWSLVWQSCGHGPCPRFFINITQLNDICSRCLHSMSLYMLIAFQYLIE